MMIRFLISTFLFLSHEYSHAQSNIPTKAFHKHIQTCNFIGTTEEDFVIVLYGDTTIKITKYTSSYRDQYSTVARQVYSGTFLSNGDTIRVAFKSNNSDAKSRIKKTSSATYTNRSVIPVQYPSTKYVIKENEILSVDYLFPRLSIVTISNIILLDSEFNNWDKGGYGRRVFGLSNE